MGGEPSTTSEADIRRRVKGRPLRANKRTFSLSLTSSLTKAPSAANGASEEDSVPGYWKTTSPFGSMNEITAHHSSPQVLRTGIS